MFDVCVIGAGTIGSSAAYYLSKRGDAKIGLIGPGEPEVKDTTRDTFGCHYDEGRITRLLAPIHTEQILAYRSMVAYKELEEKSGLKIFSEVGYAFFQACHNFDDGVYIETSDKYCAENGVELEVLTKEQVEEKWSFLSIPDSETFVGRHTPNSSGHISIRNLVAACQTVAEQNGVVRILDVVEDITKTEDGSFEVTLVSGTKMLSRKIVLTCGSFSNFKGVLKKKLDWKLMGHTVMKFEIGADDQVLMRNCPSFIVPFSYHDYVYVLPPITYPNGKCYIKLGHPIYPNHQLPVQLSTPADVQGWYCRTKYPAAEDFFKSKVKELFSNIQPVSEELDFCVMAMTTTGMQYIGFYEDNMFLAAGGNGKTGKMALEIGKMCSDCVMAGKWDYDLSEEDFRIVYQESGEITQNTVSGPL